MRGDIPLRRINDPVKRQWLVSIQSRLNQVVDESSSTGKQLIELYKEQNIALFDQNGQLRDSYDILKDLAAVWPTLTRNQQAEFALAQAGEITPLWGELLEGSEGQRTTTQGWNMPKRECLKIFDYVLISNQAPNRRRLNDYPLCRVSMPTTGVPPYAKGWVRIP